jgi:hypothetical protein
MSTLRPILYRGDHAIKIRHKRCAGLPFRRDEETWQRLPIRIAVCRRSAHVSVPCRVRGSRSVNDSLPPDGAAAGADQKIVGAPAAEAYQRAPERYRPIDKVITAYSVELESKIAARMRTNAVLAARATIIARVPGFGAQFVTGVLACLPELGQIGTKPWLP